MILPVVAYGHPVLKKVAEDVTPGYPQLKEFIADLWETMYESDGVGLAAPQVGKSVRIFVIDAGAFAEKYPEADGFRKAFINAEIYEEEGEEFAFNEGCLSFPGLREDIMRKPVIRIRYVDENFQSHDERYEGVIARIIQHEYDHIEGIVFVDRISSLRRMLLNRRLSDISKGNVDVGYRMVFPMMKKGKKVMSMLGVLSLAMLLFSCGPSREKRVAQIDLLEKQLFSPEAVSFDKPKADSLVSFYEAYIEQYPADSLAAAYLFKGANISMNAGNPSKAIAMFDRYLTSYPDQPKAPMSLFLKAFTLENQMGDIDKARETYLVFIEKYPDHDFTSQAQLALANLGKTPEMLVREWDEKRKADSARVADSLKKAGKKGFTK